MYFFSFIACYWSREGHQHKFILGLTSVDPGLKCVGNMGVHGVMVSTLDSQVCGSTSVGFFVVVVVNWRCYTILS